MNIGPKADGSLPEDVLERFAETREWLGHSSAAIYEVTSGPYPERSNVPVTCGLTSWYFHLFPGTEGRIILAQPPYAVARASLMRTGVQLEVTCENDSLMIAIPDKWRTSLVDVVAVEWQINEQGGGEAS